MCVRDLIFLSREGRDLGVAFQGKPDAEGPPRPSPGLDTDNKGGGSPGRVLGNPMDYTVHGILQARIQEWVAFPFSRACPESYGP